MHQALDFGSLAGKKKLKNSKGFAKGVCTQYQMVSNDESCIAPISTIRPRVVLADTYRTGDFLSLERGP